MNQETNNNLIIEDKIEQAFKALHHEINFASKSLS